MLASDRFRVAAIMDGERCPLLEDLANAPTHMRGQARGFIDLFKRYATHGKEGVTPEIFHLAGGDDIYRFRKGHLRVYCFKDDQSLIVLTHLSVKKAGKTAPRDLTEAEAAKKLYLNAKACNALAYREG